MQTELERRAAMYPALLSYVETIMIMLAEYESRGLHLDGDKRYILEGAKQVVAKDRRNAHVNPVMAQALNAMSPRVPDPALVALVQSDVPDFLMEQRG